MPEGFDSQFDLVMPFVVVVSSDGPFDDDAYVCGFEAGDIDRYLGSDGVYLPWTVTVHTDNLPQLDLIAMRHRYRMLVLEHEEPVEGWSLVQFVAP